MFQELKATFIKLAEENNLLDTDVQITAKQLSAKEAIGETDRKDYPLLQGKESLMQAEFNSAIGQAFTDMPLQFSGKLKEIGNLELKDSGERALFISSFNALLRHLGKADKTIHCKNEEPEQCAEKIVQKIIEKYGKQITVGIIGYQPAIIDKFSQEITPEQVRVTDLDADNIGKVKYGVTVWDGKKQAEEIFKACDVLLATGSTIVNNTLKDLTLFAEQHKKPIYFFGTSVAGPAAVLNLNRLCFQAQ